MEQKTGIDQRIPLYKGVSILSIFGARQKRISDKVAGKWQS